MTRQEKIVEAAKQYGGSNEEMCCHFIDGCHWADEHPNDEVLKLRKMFESDPDAYKQGYKDAIEKTCEWLADNLLHYWGQINANDTDEFIDNFRKAMEQQ